jgi:hypothetical protein
LETQPSGPNLPVAYLPETGLRSLDARSGVGFTALMALVLGTVAGLWFLRLEQA